MKKQFLVLAAMISAFALLCQSAEAGGRRHHRGIDKRVAVVGLTTGLAATAGYFAINNWRWKWETATISSAGAYVLTAGACAAASPIIATVVVGRELTPREATVLMAGCVVPIVGGWAMNELWNANPQWEPAKKPRRRR